MTFSKTVKTKLKSKGCGGGRDGPEKNIQKFQNAYAGWKFQNFLNIFYVEISIKKKILERFSRLYKLYIKDAKSR